MSSKVMVLDIETVRDPGVWTPPADDPEAFGPPFAHRPICVGCVQLERETTGYGAVASARLGVIDADPELHTAARELEVLRRFGQYVATHRPALVTWNGRRFDLPVLMLRSLRAGMGHAWYYASRDTRYRYSEDGHCDLADVMADYGSAPSLGLDGMAKLIGLPGKIGDFDGAGVGQAYQDGRLEEIGDYCLADAAQTAFLWLRWQRLTGRFPLEDYRSSAEVLLEACRASGRLDEMIARLDRGVLLLEEPAATEG